MALNRYFVISGIIARHREPPYDRSMADRQSIVVSNKPFIDANINYGGTYLALLVDQSISTASFPSNETASLVPGLGPDRTTRLHWWASNVTQTSEGAFINRSAPIADYGGPMPPLNDIAHTYVLYLFGQPANFSLPAEFLEGYFNPISADTRLNFSVSAVAEWVGAPLAANYFRVQNPNNTNSTSTSGSGNVSTPSATPSVYTGSAAKASQCANVALVFVAVAAFTLF